MRCSHIVIRHARLFRFTGVHATVLGAYYHQSLTYIPIHSLVRVAAGLGHLAVGTEPALHRSLRYAVRRPLAQKAIGLETKPLNLGLFPAVIASKSRQKQNEKEEALGGLWFMLVAVQPVCRKLQDGRVLPPSRAGRSPCEWPC